MRIKRALQRAAAAMVAVGVVSLGLFATTAAPASASVVGTGYVKLCNGSNYEAFVKFPNRNGLTSTLVYPNTCWRKYLGSWGTEEIEVRGVWNTNPGTFHIYSTWRDLGYTGIGFTVSGTTTNPQISVW